MLVVCVDRVSSSCRFEVHKMWKLRVYFASCLHIQLLYLCFFFIIFPFGYASVQKLQLMFINFYSHSWRLYVIGVVRLSVWTRYFRDALREFFWTWHNHPFGLNRIYKTHFLPWVYICVVMKFYILKVKGQPHCSAKNVWRLFIVITEEH